jgi:hypothetical protein
MYASLKGIVFINQKGLSESEERFVFIPYNPKYLENGNCVHDHRFDAASRAFLTLLLLYGHKSLQK